jgi:hypothetical protein
MAAPLAASSAAPIAARRTSPVVVFFMPISFYARIVRSSDAAGLFS